MWIKRDGDSVSYQFTDNDGNTIAGSSISGVIVQIASAADADKEAQNRYWDFCAERITPGGHSGREAIAWLGENWDLEPLPTDHPYLTTHRSNIALNRFPEKYQGFDISPELTDEEIERRILDRHAKHKASRECTDDQLGIRLFGYRIPRTPRNQPLFDEDNAEFEKQLAEHRRLIAEHNPNMTPPPLDELRADEQESIIVIEETDVQAFGSGRGAQALLRRLTKYIGISREDIEARSPRFIGYVYSIAESGELPTWAEFVRDNTN